MKTLLVIKGAVYFDGEDILIPHYTGEFSIVDCDRYLTKEELLYHYDKKWFNENKDNYITYEGIKYYYAEYDCYNVNENWELLSDLSELSFTEEETEF